MFLVRDDVLLTKILAIQKKKIFNDEMKQRLYLHEP